MAKLIKRRDREPRQRSRADRSGGGFGGGQEYIALTLSGLEGYLREELRGLGAENLENLGRAVGFTASLSTLYAAALRSRLAIRILRKLASFEAQDRDALHKRAAALPWEELLPPERSFAIRPQTNSTTFKNARFASQVVKDGIVDRQRSRVGRRSSIDSKAPDLQLHLRITGQRVELFLDLAPEPLSRRGYRISGGPAPINEVLAAGILEISGWESSRPLIDPFCGSGTILAEAAIKALGLPPGLRRRDWCFPNWRDHDTQLWEESISAAQASAGGGGGARGAGGAGGGVTLVGVDREPDQITAARENLRRLGAEELVQLHRGDALEFSPARRRELRGGKGVTVISNLPYGERLEMEQDELETLYRSVGEWLKANFSESDAWLLTGNLPATKYLGLRTSSRTELYNGPLECRLLQYQLY